MTSFHVSHPFVGREPLLADLDRVRESTRRQGAPCLILVHGTAGIGSSSLAAAFAGRLQESFPDGVLYFLVGDGRGPAAAGGLLRSALIQMGYPARELPDSEADQAAIYRLRTDGKRMLVVFDGVSKADQIAHLVPNSKTAVVIATTRRELRTLITQGWRPMRVPALDADSSRVLLRAMLSADFDSIDASTVSALLHNCAGHPLALRLVGAALAGQPEYAAQLAADMDAVGINALEVDGVPLVRVVLDSVYDSLAETLQPAYRWLSANPGPDFSLDAAQMLLGVDTSTAQRTVRSLVDANLLERGTDGRMGFHPLVRDHARLKARTESFEDFREHQQRIIGWYRDTGVRWESTVTRRWRESATYPKTAASLDPAARQQALRWLTAERVNLECSIAVATDIQADQIAVDLGFVLWTPFHLFGHPDTTMDALARAVDAARRLGDLSAVMQLTSQLGSGCFAVGDLDAADRYFAESLELARPLGHGLGQQSALEWLGKVAAARDDALTARRMSEAALELYGQSEAIARTPGMVAEEQLPRVLALLALHRARVFNARGEYASAAALLPDAVRHFAKSGEGDNHAKVLYALGTALLGLGDAPAARERLQPALALFEADGSLRRQAETHAALADADADDPENVRAHLLSADGIYRELGDPRSVDMSNRLRALDPPTGDQP